MTTDHEAAMRALTAELFGPHREPAELPDDTPPLPREEGNRAPREGSNRAPSSPPDADMRDFTRRLFGRPNTLA